MQNIEIENLAITFPCGGGGNFLASLLLDTPEAIEFTPKFCEYKINNRKYYDLVGSPAIYWLAADEVIHDDINTSIFNLTANTALDKISNTKFKLALGHHLPFATSLLYNFICPALLEITSTCEESDLIINLCGIIKNDINTDFSKKEYQIADIVHNILHLGISANINVENLYKKIRQINLSTYIQVLNSEIKDDKNEFLLLTIGSVTIWKYVLYSVVNDLPVNLTGFKGYLASLIRFNHDDKFSTIYEFNKQATARNFMMVKFGKKFNSIDYCDFYFNLNIPDILAENKNDLASLKEKIARYAISNLKLCLQLLTAIDADAHKLHLIDKLKNILINACIRENMLHLMIEIMSV